ncbi:zinc ribbon domain-containing protein, partial [[Clostridium] innocuum]|nr:zinc ribbon domain-containing protein [[Clostridium] innocuum]
VQIPFRTLIEMIKYKGEAAGIRVVVCEEAIQSKASSIDEDQIPVYGNDVTHAFSGKRIKRGLYRSKNGILMNANINGASNIIRKVYPCMPERERWSRGTVNVPVTCI